MDGIAMIGSQYLLTVADAGWQIAGTGDFTGDGKTDILWRHAVTGLDLVWFMDGAGVTGSQYLETVSDLNWKIR
jgi:hypothetical protein